ncbi:MAG TPA: Hpt domain-containing protein [Thermotogota bacterium]|nr:Hpt domain-containing protein [Thermotogota bacterium]HPJ89171.1 Hpt domain-containing protein [Thermotogota bacterium]HPR95666.1 Hpt domain-containing protein [Thermotogota bacterium]
MIIISDTEFIGKLTDIGFVLSEELRKSVNFLNELKLRDEDKLFLYTEFLNEIREFMQMLSEKLEAGEFEMLEDKSHELKGVTRNLKFNNLAETLYRIQLSSSERDTAEVEKSIREFETAITDYII